MLQNESCKMLCKTTIPAEDAKFVNERIRQNYAVNLLVGCQCGKFRGAALPSLFFL
jgi:hypothetical protein